MLLGNFFNKGAFLLPIPSFFYRRAGGVVDFVFHLRRRPFFRVFVLFVRSHPAFHEPDPERAFKRLVWRLFVQKAKRVVQVPSNLHHYSIRLHKVQQSSGLFKETYVE